MTGKPKTEAEQVSFFEATYERFLAAKDRTGEVRHDYRIVDTTVRLSFAGHRLVPHLTRALEHARIPPVDAPDVTLCVWDSESTGIEMPTPPCERESFTDRGDIWGFNSRRIKTAFHYHDFSVNLLDAERNVGIYWVTRARTLPYWVAASPLRTLFHWWLERNHYQLVHAAAVGTEDGAVLITGKGGVGKSTTALACLQAGLHYVADDYVIARQGPGPTVHSLYSAAKLDAGHLERFPLLREFVSNPDRLEHEKAVMFLYPHFRAQIRPEMTLKAILVPRITEREDTGFRPEASPVVQKAASFTTMSQLPCVGRHTHEYFRRLCAALPGYTLELGRDLSRIAPAVSGFLRERARAPREAAAAARPSPAPNRQPLVSVIIPVYNGAPFLMDAVESVLAQGYPSLEILIVDDGSTDATDAVVRALPVDVRYFKYENAGPAAARNRGIRDATGDLIAFLDVDDLWPDNNLPMLVEEMMRDPRIDVVHGHAQLLERDAVTRVYEYRGNPTDSFPYYIGAALFRKRVFSQVGLFDRTLIYAEDVDWFTRAHEANVTVTRLEVVTLLVRRHDQNMTHEKTLVELNMLRVFKKALDRKRSLEDGGERDSPQGDAGPGAP